MGLNMLVVDDSGVMRAMIIKTLKMCGVPVGEIHQAANGEEGLKQLEDHWVDLVLVDINMPVMNGIEFLREIKKDQTKKGIPIIVLTTQGEDALKDEALSLGAKSFMIKPFQKDELLATLKKVVG